MTNTDDSKRPLAIDLDYEGWVSFFSRIGQPSYRAGQVTKWLWNRGVSDPAEMTDLGKALREQLVAEVDFFVPTVEKEERSRDGTRKFLLAMKDGAKVETALLKQGDRLTACVSTQAGCPVGCPFCVTGGAAYERSLTRGEIAWQVLAMEKQVGREVGNVVLMGMGEPFLNTSETLAAIRILNDPKMRGLGIRHITVSTSGIVPGIQALAESGLGVRLAVSLHAANDELRDELVPCNTTYPLGDLLPALREYQQATGDRITVEYALFRDKNDSLAHARELVRTLRGIHVFVNLIPANAGRPGFERSRDADMLRFQSVLKSAGFESEIRVERGAEINAACGQLKGTEESATRPAEKAKPERNRPDRKEGRGPAKTPQRPHREDTAPKSGEPSLARPKGDRPAARRKERVAPSGKKQGDGRGHEGPRPPRKKEGRA